MNEVVMYKNELNTIVLPESFTDAEIRVFFAVISRLRDKGTSEVRFSYTYLKDITKEKKHYTKQQYSDLIQSIYHKIVGLRFAYSTEDTVGEVNLFQSYERSLTDESFTISVSPKFQYMFNQLSENGGFTAWSLGEFCDLPGIYPKQLYRLLKQWKYVGHASFKIEDLRQYMGVPEKYGTKDITRRVLNPSVSKLIMCTEEFKNLTYHYSNIGKKVYRVIFEWSPEKRIHKNETTKKMIGLKEGYDVNSLNETLETIPSEYPTEEKDNGFVSIDVSKRKEGQSISDLIKEVQESQKDEISEETEYTNNWTLDNFEFGKKKKDKEFDEDEFIKSLPL